MSQADSAYTTSRSILPAGLALRRRQFVTGGAAAALATAVTASRAASVHVAEAPDPILDAIEGHRRNFEELARISHTVFARSERVARRHGQIPRTCRPVASDDAGGDWDFAGLRGAARTGLGGPRDGVAVGSRRGRACQAGEPRALAATRRTAAQPQTSAAGQLDAIAILMRRTLIRTSAPILSSLRRMVPQLALANGV